MTDRDDLPTTDDPEESPSTWRTRVSGLVYRFFALVATVLTFPFRLMVRVARRVATRLKFLVFGNGPQDWSRRFVLVATAVLFGVAGLGLMFAAMTEGAFEGSSASVLEPLLKWGTSGPAVVLVVLFYLRGYLFFIGKTLTRKAAASTGYSRRTINRLQAESMSASGTNRVVVFPDSETEDIAERVHRALDESDYSERIRAKTGGDDANAVSSPTTEPDHDTERRQELLTKHDALATRLEALSEQAETLREDIDEILDDVLNADFDSDKVAQAIRSEEDRFAAVDLLSDDDTDRLADAESMTDRLNSIHNEMDDVLSEMESIEAELSGGSTDTPSGDLPTTAEGASEDAVGGEAAADDSDNLHHLEERKLAILDLGTTFEEERVIWQFGVPALLTFGALLLVAQIWVQWWLYLVFGALSLSVGGVSYTVQSWQRRRKLARLREDRTPEVTDQLSLLVKSVSTDELDVYIGFASGRVYASWDKDRFADVVAERAIQRAQGFHPAPAIEERYAHCLRKRIPSMKRYREAEKQKIMDQIVSEVRGSGLQMVPKDLLINAVVEHDRKYVWRGLRFVGMGFDPDLVAEAYCDLVPSALVEEDVEVEGPNGETRTITAVRTRPLSMSHDIAQLRAAFSDEFRARDFDVRYEVPEVTVDEAAPYHVPPRQDERTALPN